MDAGRKRSAGMGSGTMRKNLMILIKMTNMIGVKPS